MPWVRGPGGHWEGGRIWEDATGRRTYVIRKMVGGREYEYSTYTDSHRAALAHLERFDRAPDLYEPGGLDGEEPIRLTVELVKAFLVWSLNEKGNGTPWVGKQKKILSWWTVKLKGRDLRRVTLRDHIVPALDTAPSRRHRIEVIKAFYGWLREQRHTITRAQDPTLDLPVPQGRPEQWKTPKVIPRENHDKAWRAMTEPWRDMLTVLAGTGWHVTELERFCRAGIIADLPSSASTAHGAYKVLICPRRKSGETQRTSVSAEVAEAGARLRKRGTFSSIRFYRAVQAACVAAEIKPFSPGRYRHSVATWAIEAGADPAAVAAYLGHKSASTTRRFYATLAVVPKVPTLV